MRKEGGRWRRDCGRDRRRTFGECSAGREMFGLEQLYVIEMYGKINHVVDHYSKCYINSMSKLSVKESGAT